jgi:hypothetical protein
MASPAIVMAISRHPGVLAPSTDEILVTEHLLRVPAYGGGTLLVSSLGLAYLPVPALSTSLSALLT